MLMTRRVSGITFNRYSQRQKIGMSTNLKVFGIKKTSLSRLARNWHLEFVFISNVYMYFDYVEDDKTENGRDDSSRISGG
jgi:hypothetical protein